MLLALALAPLLITLDTWDGWKSVAAERGWQWMAFDKDACTDAGLKELEARIASQSEVDRNRVYLIGRADNAACVFYNASRLPDLWAAGVAVGGDASRAIETNKLFSANLSMVPLLWVAKPDPARRRITGVEEREQATIKDAIDFLAAKQRDPWPLKVDYETGNTTFLRCFWLGVAKADIARRNDALPTSRIPPGSAAKLVAGPFKPEDKILSVNGKDPKEFLDEARQEKDVAVLVQRGKDRVRVETKVIIPPREEPLTVRVQAEVQPATKEMLIISRGVAALRLNLPERWAPATIDWNGQPTVKIDLPSCYVLTDTGSSVAVAPCQ
jgi:hypothetical protein